MKNKISIIDWIRLKLGAIPNNPKVRAYLDECANNMSNRNTTRALIQVSNGLTRVK